MLPLDDDFCKKKFFKKLSIFWNHWKGFAWVHAKLEIVYKQGVHFLEVISLQLLHVNFIMKTSI
jgi:hypothetical protein